ncbi:MAG: aconitase X catalytic domain-containing protein [Geminicoccaceae bacterium]|nr:aconitase X catalytic domain-containing protein [Geminicoccaceae bacterium]
MQLNDLEKRMIDGEFGEPRRLALEQQVTVGRFFDASDFVPVTQAHVMADGEAVGEAGVQMLERCAAASPGHRKVMIPTITDPRGVDPSACSWLDQPEHAPEREGRIVRAFEAMGVLLTNTCINYQVVIPPTRGEHLAMGDTGSTIYCNGVLGARSNFEGGVAAFWAGLTGRVPRYGMHLSQRRLATRHFRLEEGFRLEDLADWGALGGLIGRRMRNYFEVPLISGAGPTPGSDALKHFGAALASYGSTPMFHIEGITPDAATLDQATGGRPVEAEHLRRSDLDAFYDSFRKDGDHVDVVVFAAPQLSLYEMQLVAGLLEGRKVKEHVAVLLTAPPEVVRAAERMGLRAVIEAAGARILEGVCFYQMYAREMGEMMGWKRLLTNSAKLANIIQGYGYEPVLQPTTRCIEAAIAGRLA